MKQTNKKVPAQPVRGIFVFLVMIITAIGAWADIAIDETTFPDANFRAWALSQTWGEDDAVLTDDEISGITYIDVNGFNKDDADKISNLKGIEYFTALTSLNCYNNQLTELNVSKNEKLATLNCGNNQLTELDVSDNKELKALYCYYNQLTELDVSANTALKSLYCPNNQLASLDVSSNTVLQSFECYNNYIPEAKLPEMLAGAETWTTLPQYIVGIFMNSDTIYHSDTITTESGTIDAPTAPTQTGYTFDGWYKEEALTNLWDFDTDKFTGITTLFAGFTADLPDPINKVQKSDGRLGIKFASNIVSDKAEISVVLPNNERATQTNISVYDAIGNIVFVSEGFKGRSESPLIWDLTNNARRTVANGTYLVIAEVKSANGMTYHYSAKLGVKR